MIWQWHSFHFSLSLRGKIFIDPFVFLFGCLFCLHFMDAVVLGGWFTAGDECASGCLSGEGGSGRPQSRVFALPL